MKQIKKVIAHSLVAVLCLSSFLTNTASTEAKAKKPKLSQKSMTLTKGKSKTLKVKNTKKFNLENKQEKDRFNFKKETYLLQIKGKSERNRKNHLHGKKKEKDI